MEITFGKSQQAAPGLLHKGAPQAHVRVADVNADINALTERIRVLEDHVSNLRKKTQLIEQNVLEHHRKLSADVRLLGQDITQVNRNIDEVKEKIRLLVKELQGLAKKEDVAVLQKYINFWEPVQFVTQGQLQKALQDYVKKE